MAARSRPSCGRSPVYACMLGGADGRTLFACVAPDFDEEARTAAREARLLAIRVAVPAACNAACVSPSPAQA